ncbi:enoyl-CoA hydratase/isomerase family protein [Aliiglaciecola litoralis]|uniref:3-hydroxyisobutyryl-CoA hydrolase n=1 Tax=Aliiglaciecola litoralis TaxID=582857 RepID=A0ABN1LKN3_9ALTE
MSLPVLFDLISCEQGSNIAVATLNKPEALNAIDLQMVNLLLVQLQAWQDNDDIAMVVLDSREDKAFCAGGDVVSMYQAMQQQAGKRAPGHQNTPSAIPDMMQTFFSQEYKLDYLIHTYPKPILVWGNGIIMGGGLGLMAGASHRIATETARIAMPEVSIGLFPDVGGSWFLNRMPNGCGRFLGSTGASIDASDAHYLGLADHVIEHANKAKLLAQLKASSWTQSNAENANVLTQICNQFAKSDLKTGPVAAHQQLISDLDQHSSVTDYVSAISQLDVGDDKWLKKARDGVAYGSPITLYLVEQQLRRGAQLSLADCFKMELIMACRCATYGEFQEGVRALLIDKDRSPQWAFDSVTRVDEHTINEFFNAPWNEQSHPLKDLGGSSLQSSVTGE